MPFDLPPGIGPHEGREYNLMIIGLKKVALFEILPIEFLENKSHLSIKYIRHSPYSTIAYLSGNEVIANKLLELINYQKDIRHIDEATEYAIGEILGYSKMEVSCFLEHCKEIMHGDKKSIYTEPCVVKQKRGGTKT